MCCGFVRIDKTIRALMSMCCAASVFLVTLLRFEHVVSRHTLCQLLIQKNSSCVDQPTEPIDLLVDFTVYCGLRHRYLPRMYKLWERILTTETLFMVSCWKHDTHEAPVPIHREDMVADFAPMFDTLHDESCMKCEHSPV